MATCEKTGCTHAATRRLTIRVDDAEPRETVHEYCYLDAEWAQLMILGAAAACERGRVVHATIERIP